MIGLTVSDEAVAQLKKIAATTGDSVDALAERAIRQYLRDEWRRMLQRESDAFRRLHPELLARYSGEYAAVYQGRLIDHDADQLRLLQRVEQQHPDVPVLIRQILLEPDEVYSLRTRRTSALSMRAGNSLDVATAYLNVGGYRLRET